MEIYDLCNKAVTFNDAVEAARALYEYCKNSEDSDDSEFDMDHNFGFGDDSEDDDEEFSMAGESPVDMESEDETESESGQSGEESEESEDTVKEEEETEVDESVLDEDEELDEEKEEVDEEVDESSCIGKGTGRGSTDRSSGIGSGKSGPETGVKMESIQAELKEYKEAVSFLKDKLHEVNILNAKLLFTNKLFKEFALDNNQKLKVVETFDRAQTTREIKLVYSTLAEQFGDNNVIKRKSIKESASSAIGSTKPSKENTKVISEENQVANRFRKLAGILND